METFKLKPDEEYIELNTLLKALKWSLVAEREKQPFEKVK